MAESENKGGGSIPWANITALLMAVAGGVSLLIEPLVSSRPQGGSAPVETIGVQDVDARLWQDPLRVAVEHFEKAAATDKADVLKRVNEHLGSLQSEIALRARSQTPSLLVLPVLIPGGPYADNNERRLRTRQAVVSGLSVSGFAPQDGERIGYFLFPAPELKEAMAEKAALLSARVVPYESFVPRYHDPSLAQPQGLKRVLILWMRDDLPGTNPFSTLRDLGSTLGWDSAKEKIAVLGPGTSTSLASLLKDDSETLIPDARLDGVELYAALPTAASAVMALDPNGRPVSSVTKLKAGATLYRTINPDDEVAESIIEELKRRGVDLRQNPTVATKKNWAALEHIAVISEWDTVYGRSLPLTLLGQIYRNENSALDLRSFLTGKRGGLGSGSKKEWFHTFSYLRGIDGRLPAAGEQARSAPPEKEKSGATPREATEGENQSDYLRRLAAQLAVINRDLKRTGGRGLRAVGILGSDVYDKLMILRALRSELPGVLFFTNNLDARLGLKEEWSATHNLIVVSPFGLSLDRQYQRNIPPFRDNYQTSIFASTLMITGLMPRKDAIGPPRVFEIARNGAWDLSVGGRKIDPRRLDVTTWWGSAQRWMAGFVACLGFLALLAWIATTAGWIGPPRQERIPIRQQLLGLTGQLFATSTIAAALAAIAGVIVIWPLYYAQRIGGEPLAFIQGISIWPTEMVRIAVIVLCVHFVWKSSWKIRRSNARITSEHCLAEETPTAAAASRKTWLRRVFADSRSDLRAARDRIRSLTIGWQPLCWEPFASPAGETSVPEPRRQKYQIQAEKLWKEYLERGRWSRRWMRFGPLVFFYLLSGFALMFLLGLPNVPARGVASFTIDRVLLFLCIICTTTLLFYVVDAIRLNRDLIELFNQGITVWPEPARILCARNRLLNEKELAEYLDIRLIAARTEVICPLVNYPFVILVLMIVARNSYFDNWDWPWGLIIILGLNLGWAIYCSVQLYQAARKARRTALERLSGHRLEALHLAGTALTPDERLHAQTKVKMIEETSAEIAELRRGAFAPLSDQPFFRAILFTSGSIGIGSLLQFLPNLF